VGKGGWRHENSIDISPRCGFCLSFLAGLFNSWVLLIEVALHSASLLVRLITVKRALHLYLSAWKMLSSPMAASNRVRGETRGGL
jgi:hypothetical protein